ATAIAAGLGGVIALAPPTLDRLPAPVEDGVRQVAAAVGVDLPEATAPATGAEAFTRLVALVTADDNPALTGMVVQFDPATGTVTIVPSLIDPPAGRSFELWHLEAGGDTPRSLGLFPGGPVVINASAGPGDTFAISEEPEGGSPDGSPTLPLFHGTMTVAN
ncbi:MAG: anti-sigma factor, partial [Pseudomonadota bacterium]